MVGAVGATDYATRSADYSVFTLIY
jgi:hypothetical protein